MTEEQRQALERARSRLIEQEEPGGTEPPMVEEESTTGRDALDTALFYARAINRGMFDILPDSVLNKMGETGLVNLGPPSGPLEAGFRGLGMSAFPAAAATKAMASTGFRTTTGLMSREKGVTGFAGKVGTELAESASKAPGRMLAGEAGAAFGAGAARESVPEEYPLTRQTAEIAGGVLGGGITDAPRALVRGGRKLAEELPFFPGPGAEMRAARQLQARADDPSAAAQKIKDWSGPGGVTPARITGQPRLMAMEAKILDDLPPNVTTRVEQDLLKAQSNLEDTMKNMYGIPRTRKDWELAVFKRVAAPNAKINPGETDNMLNQAYKSFEPLYDSVRGQPIKVTGLKDTTKSAINDPEIIVGKNQRETIQNWFDSQYKTLVANKEKDGVVDSEDLLKLRQVVRAKSRDFARIQGEDSRQYREVLENINTDLTAALETNLLDNAVVNLRVADMYYRQYKIVEDAVFRAGDKAFSPEHLSFSIRSASNSKSAYARGANKTDESLRLLSQAGKSIENVLGDPAAARALVSGFNDTQLRPIKADFVNTAYLKNTKADSEGNQFVDAAKLKVFLKNNKDTATALGFTNKELDRLNEIADQMLTIQRKSPGALSKLFEDGPATIMEMAAAYAGAQSGQRFSNSGLGSSLVFAQRMSKIARDKLARMTSSKATQLLNDATTDPKLYAALLTRPTSSTTQQKEAAARLNIWLVTNIEDEEASPEVPVVERQRAFTEEQQRALERIRKRLEEETPKVSLGASKLGQ